MCHYAVSPHYAIMAQRHSTGNTDVGTDPTALSQYDRALAANWRRQPTHARLLIAVIEVADKDIRTESHIATYIDSESRRQITACIQKDTVTESNTPSIALIPTTLNRI
ncbi:hypothetical protein VI26_09670 [Chromobacterium sp. LK1]|nr:hypothetical protein VI26_09670 [Chromobacterium sp. LK1]